MKADPRRIEELERELFPELFDDEPEPVREGEHFLAMFGIKRNEKGEVPWPPGFVLDWDAIYARRPPPGTVTWA